MKLNLFAGVLAASLAVPALANEDVVVASVPEFTAADTQQLFEQDARPMQLAALSADEMRETEGAFAPWVAGGLIGGGLSGLGYALGVYQGNYAWNTRNFIGNVGTGALIGAGAGQLRFLASGISGIRNFATPGGAIWAANSAIANWGVNHIWRRPTSLF